MRIISLLPSATEIVCSLGLTHQLVGISHECDFPITIRGLPRVTKTILPSHSSSANIDAIVRETLANDLSLYSLDSRLVEELQPDLIVTQTLCDVCAVAENQILAIQDTLPIKPKIINLSPQNLEQVWESIRVVATAAHVVNAADALLTSWNARLARLAERLAGAERSSSGISQRSVRSTSPTLVHRPRVAILEWIDPPFSAGHWTPELVELAGGIEVVGRAAKKSSVVAWEAIREQDPEFLVIACCGYDIERTKADLPLLESLPGWTGLQSVRSQQVYVVDGSAYFNRPGPRLVDSAELLAHILHPSLCPLPDGITSPVRL